jgi:DNA modification methylase
MILKNKISADSTEARLPGENGIHIGWFHRYPARFSQESLCQIFKGVLLKLGRYPHNILDPFTGTGASLSFAKQLGIPSFGKELTPLGVLICRVRLNPPEDLDCALAVAQQISKAECKGNSERINPELRVWIGEENSSRLDCILSKLADIKDERIHDWLHLALSSALRPSSIWLAGSIKPQVDPLRSHSDIRNHFLRMAKTLRKDCQREICRYKPDCPSVVFQGDSCHLELESDSVDVILTSPPYGSMYDYFDVHRLSYLAFGWKQSKVQQIGKSAGIERDGNGFIPPSFMKRWYYNNFRREVTIEGRSLRAYFQGMNKHLREAHRVLRPGGVIAYAVADSIKKGRTFALTKAFVDLLKTNGFSEVQIKLREQNNKRILPAGRDVKTGRFDSTSKPSISEYIIYAGK